MNSKRSSYVIVTVCLAALLLVSLLAAGCTDSAKSSATPVPTTVNAVSTPAATTVASAATTVSATPAATSSGQKQTITISGSTTVLPIVQKAADQYMATHPDADIQVSGGGSGVGIQAIGAKTVDIGMSSREVTSAEKAKYPAFNITTVAHDGIAVIVNPQNQIQYITPEQVKKVYLGKITKWTEISGANVPNTNNAIVLVGRDSASGTRSYFDESVLLKATPSSKMLEKNSNGAVTQTIAQTPGAIGYVSIGYITSDVKAVPIWYNANKIVTPSVATVKDKSYPLSRDLYIITNGQTSSLTQDFIQYLLGADGQKIVANEGYVPLTA